jgi:alkanesulfonate monooxygenase
MVGPSKDAVRAEMVDWLNKEWDFPANSDCSRESAILGSVDDCVAQLKEHLAVGVQKIIFVPYKYQSDQVEIIAREIIPRLKA